MRNDPIFIDTCCFSDSSFISWLKEYHGRKMISVITYAELCYHFIFNRHKDIHALRSILHRSMISIENINPESVRNSMEFVRLNGSNQSWCNHPMDYLISGHISCHPTKLITQNVRHFSFLKSNVMNMYDFQKMIKSGHRMVTEEEDVY
jgi:hypothetical protein